MTATSPVINAFYRSRLWRLGEDYGVIVGRGFSHDKRLTK